MLALEGDDVDGRDLVDLDQPAARAAATGEGPPCDYLAATRPYFGSLLGYYTTFWGVTRRRCRSHSKSTLKHVVTSG
jgi:hypothetical protein